MKREEIELKRKVEEQAETERQMQESGVFFPEIPKAESV